MYGDGRFLIIAGSFEESSGPKQDIQDVQYNEIG